MLARAHRASGCQCREVDQLKSALKEPQVKRLLEQAKHLDAFWYPHWTMAV
jgi:hypothetical protein